MSKIDAERCRRLTASEVVVESGVYDRIERAVAERDVVCKERKLVEPGGKLHQTTSAIYVKKTVQFIYSVRVTSWLQI